LDPKSKMAVRFHSAGLVVFGLFLLIALAGGAWSAVTVVRIAVAVFAIAAFVEVVVNMIRHHDFRVRSRLLGFMGDQGTFPAWRSRKQ
jgi:hypothetical protein